MAEPAPTEIPEIPVPARGDTKIVHLPTQELKWRESVVAHTQAIDPSFSVEHATPPATQPIPSSKALEEVGAERVGAEPIIDIANVTDVMRKTAGHVIESVGGEEGLLAHAETAPGPNIIPLIKKRRGLKKAA